jgi:hypothetical protein
LFSAAHEAIKQATGVMRKELPPSHLSSREITVLVDQLQTGGCKMPFPFRFAPVPQVKTACINNAQVSIPVPEPRTSEALMELWAWNSEQKAPFCSEHACNFGKSFVDTRDVFQN